MLLATPASPILAQQASSTATSTRTSTGFTVANAQVSNSALGTAALVGLGVGVAAIGVSAVSSLLFRSFGGRVATVIPCVSGLGPSLHVTVIPFGGFPGVAYIWTPATITYSFGPPTHPGQQVLGVSDIPFVCFTPTTPPVPLYGFRMQSVGTSPFL